MGLGTVSVCLTVLVLNLHHRDSERPVPRLLRLVVLRYLARILCVSARKPKTMADNLLLETPNGSLVSLNAGLGQIAQKAELLAQKAELLSRPGLGPNATAQKSELLAKKAGLSRIVAAKKVELVNQSPSLKAPLAGTHKAELRTQEEELPNRPLPVLGRRVELLRRRKAGLRQNGCLEKYLSCHLANATGCDHTHEWKEIAHVLDRLFFCIVLVFMTASVMMIALVPYYKDDLNK